MFGDYESQERAKQVSGGNLFLLGVGVMRMGVLIHIRVHFADWLLGWKQIHHTMKAIKHTLTERWYTWDMARSEAMLDEEVNMYADVDKGEIAYLRKGDDFEVSFASEGGWIFRIGTDFGQAEQDNGPLETSQDGNPPGDIPKTSTEARA